MIRYLPPLNSQSTQQLWSTLLAKGHVRYNEADRIQTEARLIKVDSSENLVDSFPIFLILTDFRTIYELPGSGVYFIPHMCVLKVTGMTYSETKTLKITCKDFNVFLLQVNDLELTKSVRKLILDQSKLNASKTTPFIDVLSEKRLTQSPLPPISSIALPASFSHSSPTFPQFASSYPPQPASPVPISSSTVHRQSISRADPVSISISKVEKNMEVVDNYYYNLSNDFERMLKDYPSTEDPPPSKSDFVRSKSSADNIKLQIRKLNYPEKSWTIRKPGTINEKSLPRVITWAEPNLVQLDKISRYRYDDMAPAVIWGCWDPKKPFYGALLLKCGRPNFAVEDLPKEAVEFNEAIDLEFMDCVYLHGHVLNADIKKHHKPMKIHIFDTGRKCPPLEANYSSYFQFEYMDLTEIEVDKAFLSLYEVVTKPIEVYQTLQKFVAATKETKWLFFVSLVLKSVSQLSTKLLRTQPIIIQCASAKHEVITPMITSLLLLLADPYYRTLNNFLLLIEKEWFPQRNPIFKKFQSSSVFFLFIHCVYEIIQQQPTLFEFNENYLACIMDALYDGVYEGFGGENSLSSLAEEIVKYRENLVNPMYMEEAEFVPLVYDEDYLGNWNSYILRWNDGLRTEGIRTLASEKDKTTENLTVDLFWKPKSALSNELTGLALKSCHLTSLPDAIMELKSLKNLSLNDNPFAYIPPKIMQISLLQTLHLKRNNIRLIPPQISNLQNLKELCLDSNRLATIDNLCKLPVLRVLSLRGNRVSTLPYEFYKLTTLTSLDLKDNKIAFISGFILKNLSRLKRLSIENNQIKEIPENISFLQDLEELNLNKNSLQGLPLSFNFCSQLLSLRIGYNRFSFQNFPREIGLLTKLRELDISGNVFPTVPDCISKCNALRLIQLHNVGLQELPLWLSDLIFLEGIDVSSNEISVLSHSIGQLRYLKVLNLDSTQLHVLPATLGLCTTLEELKLAKTPLEPPFSNFAERPTAELLKFLRDRLNDDEHTYRMKIMLVGQENVGKTSVRMALSKRWTNLEESSATPRGHTNPFQKFGKRRLQTPGKQVTTYQLLSTDGIDITTSYFDVDLPEKAKKGSKLKKKKHTRTVMVNFWDFAGQEVYYGTHQFFLSGRAIYLLVFKLTDKSAEARLDWWIQTICARIFKPSVVIVGTHLEDKSLDRSEVSKKMEEMEHKFRKNYHLGAIKSFAVSCSTEEGLSTIKSALEKLICQQKEMAKVVKTSYLLLEEALLEYRKKLDVPMITFTELVKFASTCNIKNLGDIEEATKEIHDMGSIIYFHNEPQLRDCIIVDPQWLTHMMATLFTTKHRFIKKGILLHTDLNQIWKEYPSDIHQRLLLLLEKFEISHTIPFKDVKNLKIDNCDIEDTGICLIPALFPTTRPTEIIQSEWPTSDPNMVESGRIFRFGFLPAGLFSRLIVKVLSLCKVKAVWSQGLIGDYPQMEAKIYITHYFWEFNAKESDKNVDQMKQNELSIRIRAVKKQNCHTFLCIVLDIINNLLGDWPNLTYEEYFSITTSDGQIQLKSVPEIEAMLINGQKSITVKDKDYLFEDVVPDISLANYKGEQIAYSELEEGELIGTGGFATIHKGKFRGVTVAIKKLLVDSEQSKNHRSKQFSQLRHEALIQTGLSHPNITKVLCISFKPFAMILEYLPLGNLYDYVKKWENPLPWDLRIKFSMDIAEAIRFMHEKVPIISHLDIKSPNVLISSLNPGDPVCAKLADFGTAQPIRFTLKVHPVDNPVWLAPEALSRNAFDEKVDIYAFGVVCWELLTREEFFGEFQFMSEISDAVISGRRPEIPKYCPPQYKSIIEKCWTMKPEERPKWSWVLETLEQLKATGPALETTYGAQQNAIIYDKKIQKTNSMKQKEDVKQAILEDKEKAERRAVLEQKLLLQALENNDLTEVELEQDPQYKFDQLLVDKEEYRKFRTYLESAYTSDFLTFYKEATDIISSKNVKNFPENMKKGKKLIEDLLYVSVEETEDNAIFEKLKQRTEEVREMLMPVYVKFLESVEELDTLSPIESTFPTTLESLMNNEQARKEAQKYFHKAGHIEFYTAYKKLNDFSKTIGAISDPKKRQHYALEILNTLSLSIRLHNHQSVITGIRSKIASVQFTDDIFDGIKKEVADVLTADLLEYRKRDYSEVQKKRKDSISRMLLSPRVLNSKPKDKKDSLNLEEFLQSPENVNSFAKFLGTNQNLLHFYEKYHRFKAIDPTNQDLLIQHALAIGTILGIEQKDPSIIPIEIPQELYGKIEKIIESRTNFHQEMFDDIFNKEILPNLEKLYEDSYLQLSSTRKRIESPQAKYTILSKKPSKSKNKDSPSSKSSEVVPLTLNELLTDKHLYKEFSSFLVANASVVENLHCLKEINEYRTQFPSKKAHPIINSYLYPDLHVSLEASLALDTFTEFSSAKEPLLHLFDRVWTELSEVVQDYILAFSKSYSKKNKIKLKMKKGASKKKT